jgi:hypothetical protein
VVGIRKEFLASCLVVKWSTDKFCKSLMNTPLKWTETHIVVFKLADKQSIKSFLKEMTTVHHKAQNPRKLEENA